MEENAKDTAESNAPSDAERLAWVLRYGFARRLGVVTDFEYIPLTLDLIDKAIVRERAQPAAAQPVR
jgi:hypothetical protein